MSTRKPIYVFEGGGSDPHVIATIDTDKFSDHDSKAETAIVSRKVNNISTIEITIPTNCEASKLITNTSDLVLFDSKGNIQEFHITDIDDMDEYSVNRTIYAEQSFGELINNIVTGDTAMPTTTNPSDYLAYILSFTRWSVGTVDTSIYNAKWEEDLTGLTCLEAFQKLVDKYNCEFEIRYTIDRKNKITGRYVDLKKKIGNNYGKRFEDKKDIIGLKRNLDLDSVKTAIYPRIKIDTQDENGNSVTTYIDISSVAWSVSKGDPVDKPLGQTVLVNPEADEIYKRYNTKNGKLMEKIMYAEWTGDTASDAEDLCRQAWSILKANGVLTPTIEVTASDLYRMSGNNSDYSHEQVDLGDTCIIIDKNFEPELRITTRVMEIEEDILNPVNNTYVFGNYRKTLATSNIESQKSIENQLTQLQDKIQSITIPEYSLPYQSGKDYYADIKEQVQNEFMSSSGYVMAQDADGFWVFDAPVAQTYSLKSRSVATVHPTKATILKGGCLALAEYNTATSSWEISTFINGTSVNADCINTGHLSGNLIEANSITADHLKIAAIEYIRNGLATEADLQNVINDIQTNYATTTAVSNAISDAVAGLDPDVAAANAKVNSINISFDAIDIEYRKNLQQANTLNKNSYLTGTAKTNLSDAKADYISKFRAVQTAKDDIVNNVDVSDTKMTAYNNALSAFKTSATTLGIRMEEAATAINSAVASDSKKYADGLKTTLDSEISDVSSSVSNLESTMNNAFKDSVISEAEAIAIQQQLDRLDTEKTDIDNEYSTLMYNSNLTGTAKTTLTSKYNAHATAYTNLVNAINNAIGDNNVDNTERTEIENCKTAYNNALGEYRTSAQSAIDAISSKRVEDAVVNVVSSEALQNVINTAIQGLATEDYVNGKASQAKDEATIAAQVKAITDLQKQLQTEYKENNAKANKVYSDKYLPAGSTAKTDLNNKISAYTTAYNNYNNYITTMLSDSTVTNEEYSKYSSYADAYSTALKNLAEAMEVANSTRLENVYAQARAGLVTTAELEVNNESVIASAKAGMVSTADMTSAISTATKDMATTTIVNTAVTNATKDMATNSSVNTAITNATKDMATNSSVNTAVSNAVKDKVTNTQMNSAISNATKDMATNSSVNTAVSNATKDMATNAGVTNAINGITVGSRNLALLTSDDWVSFSDFKGGTNDCKLSYTVLTKGLSVNDKLLVAFDYKLENMTYASGQSPAIKIQGSGDVTKWNSGQFNSVNIDLGSKPANASGTAYTIANVNSDQLKNSYWYCNFRTDYITGGTVSIKGIRVIRSSKLVSWVAAPEDAYTNTVLETFKSVTAEYNNNYKIATTLYSNSYLSGTAKTNLKTAYDDYATKYNAVKTAHDAISTSKYADEGRKTAWNTALTNLQSSTTTLAQRVQEASTFINTAVYNASKSYTDTAIPDALTGYAKTKYVDDAKAAAIADAKKGMVSTSQLEVNNTEILMKTASMGQYNLLRNTDYRAGTEHWSSWGTGTGIKVKIGTSSDYGNCMSGEKNLGVTTDNSITSLDHSVGFKQYVELTGNVTYTLSYWVNCVKCKCVINIETNDTIGGENTGILATKNYTNINGNQNRETWKYDSISFTVPKLATAYDKKAISVVFYIDSVSKAQARAWLVKPMLATGINAQAWTAHPDEIHVGVVSVTEQEGIKVEHSDFDTYTTLNAAGLKIRSTNDDSLVASFGENNSAYIGRLTCDGYVKAPQLMPVAKYNTVVHMYYCSETGSGDFSGKSSNNQAIGWGGVMRALLSDLDIDYTHEKGGFIIPSDFNTPITIYIKGTEFSSDIVLGNIFGGGNSALQIKIDSECKFTGRIILSDIDIDVSIYGNNSTMYRGSSKDAPITLDDVKYCYIYQLKINYSSQQIATVAVQMYDSNCNMTKVDMCNCYSAAALNRSHLFMSGCSGNLNSYVNGGQLGYLNLYGKVPAYTSSNPYGSYCINTTPSNRTLTPTGTTQSGGSSVTMNVTKTINITTYSSVLEYYRYGCLIQGTPNGSSISYVGNMTVSNVNKVLATMNNDVVIQVFLEREGTTTVDTDYVDVVIDGTNVGTLRSTASGWFNLPSSTVDSLKKNETVTIKLNATGRSNYTQYKLNAMLKITGTQTV